MIIIRTNRFPFMIALAAFCFVLATIGIRAEDHLRNCMNKQVKPLEKGAIKIEYAETLNEFYHSFKPWQELNYVGGGAIWLDASSFYKTDSLVRGKRKLFSKTQLRNDTLLLIDYGDNELKTITRSMVLDQPLTQARYSPNSILSYFNAKKLRPDAASTSQYAVYKTEINKKYVTLYIDKKDNLVKKIEILADDELYGDVLSAYFYEDYSVADGVSFPKTIRIQNVNGRINDEVKIVSSGFTKVIPKIIEPPLRYEVADDTPEVQPDFKTMKFADWIYLVDLHHVDERSLIAEFKDFLLVAEAPLSSKNGELIISEARKIAPDKPIRYFAFGHFHQHYLGGVRAFVHKGSEIITPKADIEYLRFIIEGKRALNPDSLAIQPKKLRIKELTDSLTITDGEKVLKIYMIGEKSAHTHDFLIFYFPKEKIIFEGDLVWIPKEGEVPKAGERQAGLYNALKELGVETKTIIQSWPLKQYGVKTIIQFDDLEKSMQGR